MQNHTKRAAQLTLSARDLSSEHSTTDEQMKRCNTTILATIPTPLVSRVKIVAYDTVWFEPALLLV